MMKAAFAAAGNRIAPVFDVARQVHLVDEESGRIVSEAVEPLASDLPVRKALDLIGSGVGTLVCGAISRPLVLMIMGYGIRVIPFVAGDLPEVIRAWLDGTLEGDTFAMPGCCGRGLRRYCGMHDHSPAGCSAEGSECGGTGAGNRPRRGRNNRGPRHADRACPAAGEEYRVCPQCGYREPEVWGMPFVERRCPRCGTALTGA